MKYKLSYLIFILAVLFKLYSCTPEDYCTETMVSKVNAGFYTVDDEETKKMSFYNFLARGYQLDSILNSDTTGVTGIILPLSNLTDSCSFIFTYTLIIDTITTRMVLDTIISLGTVPDSVSIIAKDSLYLLSLPDTLTNQTQLRTRKLADTIQFFYTRELIYISPACGFMYNYRINNIVHTHNLIDRILIVNPYISILEEENIQIMMDTVSMTKSYYPVLHE
jgi:hypothetical protein